MKKVLSIILLSLILQMTAQTAHTQKQGQALIDSLLTELPKQKEDTNKVNTLNGLSRQNYLISNYDTSLYYAEKAKALAENLNFQKGIANSYVSIGLVYYYQGNYPEALKSYFAALKIVEETGNKHGIGLIHNLIGGVYSFQGNTPEALSNYFAALKIEEEIGNKREIAVCYGNIGWVYCNQGNYPEALKNLFAGLKINEEIGNKKGIASSYNNIGIVYNEQGNYSEALENYFASLKIREEVGNKHEMAGSYINIGSVYTKLNQAKEGKDWLQKGLDLSSEMGAKEWIKNAYSNLAIADNALGNYKGAYENHKMYILYRDSLYNEENTKKTTQLEMQFEFDKKQLADSLQHAEAQKLATVKLQRQKTYTYTGIVGVMLLMVFVFFIAKERKKSEKLLLNILPAEIADELKAKGDVAAKQFEEVSVLFTDFVNFTQTAEQLTPEQLVQELHECFTAFDGIMEKHGLEKIKTIGDAYLAVCGLPTADKNHAQKTVQAAIEIRDFIAQRKQKENTFDIRIGIHSGSVVAGIVGVKKFAYDIWGDTVNTAARMESSGEAGKVNISETTYEKVKENFICEYRGEIEAKNKGKMKMYFANNSLIDGQQGQEPEIHDGAEI